VSGAAGQAEKKLNKEKKMKKNKKLNKKLALNKKTIVNLSDSEKTSILGGYDPTQETMCTHTDTCCTWWYTCETRFNSICQSEPYC
jgi:hypothetical protein